jgi:hypothetical protein
MNAVHYIFFFSLLAMFVGCTGVSTEKNFDFFLNEPCMITNFEQNNLIEGTQLRVIAFNALDSSISIELPNNFAVTAKNFEKWTIGWGQGKPYFDAGVENIRGIRKIDVKNGKIYLDKSRRGTSFPRIGQRIVFWNMAPSNYQKIQQEPIIRPEFWPTFHGESIGFSSIVFDQKRSVWITLVNEIDSDKIQIYAAISSDLIHWAPANQGKPILCGSDFKGCSWTTTDKTPIVSEIIQHEGKYYVFMDGENGSGKRNIGLATTNDLLGNYSIFKTPILSPQPNGSWNDQSVFCAKVAKRSNDFVLFFDGRNDAGYEQVGRATSNNLTSWKIDNHPALDQHEGWRSAGFTSEPNYIEVNGDTVFLMVAGAKKFQESWWHHHFTHRNFMDRSGNVNDAQLGAFISIDGGKTFLPHPNNPIFVNNFADPYENEHIGGNIERIETDSMSYLFYQSKTSFSGMKYSIFLRSRAK